MLARWIAARDSGTVGGMTAKEFRDQAVTILMAGNETTAQALSWTWYLLVSHPAVEGKLHDELATVLAGRAPRYEDFADLRYTRMVIENRCGSFRQHTLWAGNRSATMKCWAIAFPQVRSYDPTVAAASQTCTLGKSGLLRSGALCARARSTRPRFAYIPFGAGPRICIGAAFAMAEAMIILATIAQRYRLRLKPGFPVEPQGLITLRPRHGLRMILERRTDVKAVT